MSSIIVVGVNHTTAPVEMRERMALSNEKMKEVMAMLHRDMGPNVVLSTCNRTEIYAVGKDPLEDSQKLVNFLSRYHHLPKEEFTSRLYAHVHEAAIRHLFQVASGLDSMILGEEQILAQVRRALALSESNGCPGQPLGHLFRQALRVGKRARTETAISRHVVSVSHASVELAQQVLGDLSQRTVLIIGSGEMGSLSAKIAQAHGAGRIVITNRTPERAAALAAALKGETVPWADLPSALAQVDIAISATGASGFVLTSALVAEAMRQRPQRPLILIDIAVPRDVDPEVKTMGNVCLYDIDDLQAFSQSSLAQRQGEAVKVEALIDGEMEKTLRWWNIREIMPTIAALRNRAEAIRQAEMAKTLRRLRDLDPQERLRVEAMSRAIVNKLLHQPTVLLKDADRGRHYLPTVQELFDLKDGS